MSTPIQLRVTNMTWPSLEAPGCCVRRRASRQKDSPENSTC
ncbi:hypothetical protein CCUS01_12529 [Colletotrichum cuscutae]|uniref:Uncharacterized protein n=1 Tax=Colletotrichum cuscutae TaxID=1209917 RepID=A0AAI9TVH5_9PEZI|nr:hypothetical protein CCUS01_12529 [Colletotrichum cuscutae]